MFMRLKLLPVLHWLVIHPITFNWTAAAVVGGSIISGVIGAKGAKEGAATSAAATDRATAENARQFDVAQEYLAPYRAMGDEFLPDLKNFMRGDYKGFLDSPDYKFSLEEGTKAIDRKASAAGSRYGGAALKEAAGYASGLASQHTDKYFSKLFNVVGIGSNAAAGTAQGAISTGQANANIVAQGGRDQASMTMAGYNNAANAVNSGIGNLTTLSMYNDMMSKMPATA